MAITASDYRQQLQALLPAGPAWDIDSSADISAMLDGLVQEFARLHSRIDVLVDESDPRLTYELLADYERNFGLPTDCMQGIAQTLDQRRAALVAQMTGIGNQSRAFYIELARSAGYNITITEFRPADVTMTVDALLVGDAWAYAWQVNASLASVSYFTVASGVDEALSSWGNTQLECLINRYKPAHTIVIFSYT